MIKKRITALALILSMIQPVNIFAYSTNPANPSEQGKTVAELNGYSEEAWSKLMDNTLEYAEIDDLVKNFNVNISSSWDKFNENVNSLNTAIDTLKASRRDMESSETAAINDGEIENAMLYKAQAKGLGLSIQAMSISRDKLSRQVSSTNAPIRNAQSQVAAGVRALMIGYKNIEAQEQILDLMVKMYEEILSATTQSKNLGLSTSTDITKAMSELTNAKANLISLRANKDKIYRSLISMCGWNPDTTVNIGSIPELSDVEINALNPAVDINTAIGNNAALIEKRHNTSSKSTTFVDAKLYQSGKDEDMLRANINQIYEKILADKKAMDAAVVGNQAAGANENALDIQKKHGMITNAQYLGGKLGILQKRAELESAKLELRTDYNTYIQALEGNVSIE